jgi:MoaA/NifB/PqqE/SkfB family radical SAM enzyme
VEHLSCCEFSANLHQRHAERVPLHVSIEVTRRCSLECRQCYNNLPMGDLAAKRRGMTKEEHFRMLDELVDMGRWGWVYA